MFEQIDASGALESTYQVTDYRFRGTVARVGSQILVITATRFIFVRKQGQDRCRIDMNGVPAREREDETRSKYKSTWDGRTHDQTRRTHRTAAMSDRKRAFEGNGESSTAKKLKR
jgi:hypothetical protein